MFTNQEPLIYLLIALGIPSLQVLPAEPAEKPKEADFKQLEEKRTDAYAGQLEAWLASISYWKQ